MTTVAMTDAESNTRLLLHRR